MSDFAAGFVRIRGARTHNLKNVDADIPKNALTVVTGVSGCGKSSLAMDTLFAEGQRRYVESLSTFAREMMARMPRPDVDAIEGLCPAVAVEQRRFAGSGASSVADITGLAELFALLFAKTGVPRCPVHDVALSGLTPATAMDRMMREAEGRRVMLCAPLGRLAADEVKARLPELIAAGFVRYVVDDVVEVWESVPETLPERARVEVVVDRLRLKPEHRTRLVESIEAALRLGGVRVFLRDMDSTDVFTYACAPVCPHCDYEAPTLERRHFLSRAAQGRCPVCLGRGSVMRADEPSLVADVEASVTNGALPLFTLLVEDAEKAWSEKAKRAGVSPEAPWQALPTALQAELLSDLSRLVEEKALDKGPLARAAEEHLFEATCEACDGTGLSALSRTVYLESGEKRMALQALMTGTVENALAFFRDYEPVGAMALVADAPLAQIRARLTFIESVGLGYLTLSRRAATLSGGEAQRLRLSGQLGGGLSGLLYVLDEPTSGLHPLDAERLMKAVAALRDLGNTVLMVEHSLLAMRAADWIIDMGPGAGEKGGEVLAQGAPEATAKSDSPSARYLAKGLPAHTRKRRKGAGELRLTGACGHNLKGVELPLLTQALNVVCGVSGSGKSSLVIDTLYAAMAQRLMRAKTRPLPYKTLEGLEAFEKVLYVDQSPLGRSPRSIVATCTGLFAPLREVFAQTQTARERGYDASRFSFNVKGGRCEACEGEGTMRIDMEFMPDLWVPCEVCAGKRYNEPTLEVRYKGHSMADVLEMSVEEAAALFADRPAVARKLEALQSVGLGYVKLGQSALQFSGGEAQRVKLAAELAKPAGGKTLFVLDEPTAGLHMADVEELLGVFDRLIEEGNTVLVVEHNLQVLRAADRLVELGPGAGDAGGRTVALGTPETVATSDAPTAAFLRE